MNAKRGQHASVAGARGTVKRSLDLAVSFVLLVVLSPLLVLIAAAIRLTSRGRVLFRQERLGLGGRPFTMLKFRTMRRGAEPNGRAVWAIDDDARCTYVGGVLRRFGLDELPQLVNVLRGEMSLVGPRPERDAFASEFERAHPGFGERLAVRGGITGLAQVDGFRGDTDIGDRLARDLEYIARWSLRRDAWILARTIPAVIWPKRLPPRAVRRDGFKPEVAEERT